MFLGHYGLALAAKELTPRTSLGTTTFAANLADTVWPILLVLGIEQVAVDTNAPANEQLVFVSYPWSHSLLMGLVGALVVGAFIARRDRRAAVVCGALVVSHWFLDLPFHLQDLPLWPGTSPRVGFALWDSLAVTLVAEALVFFGGLVVYLKRTKAIDRLGTIALAAYVAFLLAIYASEFVGPPMKAVAVGWSALVLWLFVPWTYWIDRHRTLR